ncbi:MAG: hypothetical protein RSA21_01710 [Akkermansia sp.]
MKPLSAFTCYLVGISILCVTPKLLAQDDTTTTLTSDQSDSHLEESQKNAIELQEPARAFQITDSPDKIKTSATSANRFQIEFPAPTPGLPMPMSRQAMENATMTEAQITLGLRQHEALVICTCLVNFPEDADKDDITLAMPFIYNLPEIKDNALSPVPVHRIPFKNAIKNIQVGCNDIKIEWQLMSGQHPHADAPSLQSIKNVNHWLSFKLKHIKPGINVITITFTAPYHQSIEGQLGQNAYSSLSSPRFDFITSSALGWNKLFTAGKVNVFPEEMLPESLQIISPPAKERIAKSSKGVLSWDIISQGERLSNRFSILVGPGITAKAETPGILAINNQKYPVIKDYKIVASSSINQDPAGNSCSPENLRMTDGFWAEGVPGDGAGEYLDLTLPIPKKLTGFIIQTGVSPLVLSKHDTEAQKRPDIAFSLYSRPHTVKVILNGGEYDFKATLRDDWNVQMIHIPYFDKPVRTIRLELESVYPGTSSDDTYMSLLLPVAK